MKENSKYDIDYFERLLSEKSDEFVLYPSKRVWFSVYNNLHPSRKWPSVAMCIFLLTSLLLIGYLNNNNNLTRQSFSTSASKQQTINDVLATNYLNPFRSSLNDTKTPQNGLSKDLGEINQSLPKNNLNTGNFSFNEKLSTDIKAENQKSKKQLLVSNKLQSNVSYQDNNNFTTEGTKNKAAKMGLNGLDTRNRSSVEMSPTYPGDASVMSLVENKTPDTGDNNGITSDQSETIVLPNDSYISQTAAGLEKQDLKIVEMSKSDLKYLELEERKEVQEEVVLSPYALILEKISSSIYKDDIKRAQLNLLNTSAFHEKSSLGAVNASLENEKGWIENYALYNRKPTKNWKGKLGWQAYFAPSYSYRHLKDNAPIKPINAASPLSADLQNVSVNQAVAHQPSYGFEAGATLIRSFLKGVKLKAGIQFNYTRYSIQAFNNFHSIGTSVSMNESRTGVPYQVFKSTPYSSKIGLSPINLHNQTFQISVPVGLDLKLAGNDRLEWFAGATIQPTIVAGAKIYLISSDKRYYVEDKSLLNRWNMNAGFETYISYKANGYTWQLGPQYRTQLFSTNTRLYSIEEKIYNFGFKLGVTRVF